MSEGSSAELLTLPAQTMVSPGKIPACAICEPSWTSLTITPVPCASTNAIPRGSSLLCLKSSRMTTSCLPACCKPSAAAGFKPLSTAMSIFTGSLCGWGRDRKTACMRRDSEENAAAAAPRSHHAAAPVTPFGTCLWVSLSRRGPTSSFGAVAPIVSRYGVCDPARSQTSSTMDTTGLYSSERFNNSYRTTTLESTAMPGIKWSDKRFRSAMIACSLLVVSLLLSLAAPMSRRAHALSLPSQRLSIPQSVPACTPLPPTNASLPCVRPTLI